MRDAEGRDPAMGSQPRPLAFREMREDEQLVAHFLQAIGDRAAEERLALRFDLRPRVGVDHIVVIGEDFLHWLSFHRCRDALGRGFFVKLKVSVANSPARRIGHKGYAAPAARRRQSWP